MISGAPIESMPMYTYIVFRSVQTLSQIATASFEQPFVGVAAFGSKDAAKRLPTRR
jgi:hypothetical protein